MAVALPRLAGRPAHVLRHDRPPFDPSRFAIEQRAGCLALVNRKRDDIANHGFPQDSTAAFQQSIKTPSTRSLS
jgi:hypothetical protein